MDNFFRHDDGLGDHTKSTTTIIMRNEEMNELCAARRRKESNGKEGKKKKSRTRQQSDPSGPRSDEAKNVNSLFTVFWLGYTLSSNTYIKCLCRKRKCKPLAARQAPLSARETISPRSGAVVVAVVDAHLRASRPRLQSLMQYKCELCNTHKNGIERTPSKEIRVRCVNRRRCR